MIETKFAFALVNIKTGKMHLDTIRPSRGETRDRANVCHPVWYASPELFKIERIKIRRLNK